VELNWSNDSVRYRVPNPLMAAFYRDALKKRFGLSSHLRVGRTELTSCADLLARALPCLSFLSVIQVPTIVNGEASTPMSEDLLPFEDNYNNALVKALEELGYTVSQPQGPTDGKPDLYLRYNSTNTMAIEAIMTTRPQVGSALCGCDVVDGPACGLIRFLFAPLPQEDHTEHRDRFNVERQEKKKDGSAKQQLANYSEATRECLLTIGASRKLVLQRVKNTKANGVEVIGLVVSPAHDCYDMYVKNDDETIQGPFRLLCDHVAKALQVEDGVITGLVAAQEFASWGMCRVFLLLQSSGFLFLC
jgi:hypothetical protein